MWNSRARLLTHHQNQMTKLLAIIFWATLAAYALATFLDPEFPGILDIINCF